MYNWLLTSNSVSRSLATMATHGARSLNQLMSIVKGAVNHFGFKGKSGLIFIFFDSSAGYEKGDQLSVVPIDHNYLLLPRY